MDDPSGILRTAIADFKTRLSDQQISNFTTTTLQHVQVQIIILQRDQEKAKAMINFNRFRSFLEALKQFEDVFKALNMGVDGLAAYIWGPTKSILKDSKEDTKAMDCILTSYSNFGQHLPLIAEYKAQLCRQPDTKICLAWMYQDLLRFSSSLMQLFATRGWRKTFAANWKDCDGPFQALLRAFDGHGRFLKRTLERQRHRNILETHRRVNDHVVQYQGDRDEIAEFLEEYRRDRDTLLGNAELQEIERKRKQYLDVVHWLHSPGVNEPEKQYQSEFLGVRSEYPDTGKWILREDKVRDWIEAEIPVFPIMWIHGKKGAGKTILASLIIDHLTKETNLTTENKDFKTSYFYCRESEGSLGESRIIAIMKSLLRQMVDHNRDLLPTLHGKRMRGQEILNDETTAKTLMELFCDINLKQFIVIDGLDELGEIHRERLVQLLDSLVERSQEYSPGRIRVLFLSTDLTIMRKTLQSTDRVAEYSLDPNRTRNDIKSYVAKQASELQQKFPISAQDLERAQALTCERSNGMFLYAFLVTDNLLRQPNTRCVLSELQETRFPVDLKQAYGKIIERLRTTLHPNTWKEARKVFGWLAYAKRPLKWHELHAALSINIDDQGCVEVQDPTISLCIDIREICGSLVHLPGGTSIDFIHQTAKEFVMDKENLDGRALECDLALLCLQFLSHTCFDANLEESSREYLAKEGCYAFQDYAVSQWHSHLKGLIDNTGNLFDDPDSGLEYTRKASNALQDFCSVYRGGLTEDQQIQNAEQHAEEARRDCQPFEQQDFYANLLEVWTHVVRHQNQTLKERNNVSIKQLRTTLEKTRAVLEELAPELNNNDALAGSLKKFYGLKFFKCTRITCGYFYEGFDSKGALDHHSNRHDRPYPCTVPNCSLNPFGFQTNKDLDKHLRNYHPEMSDQPSAFAQLGQRRAVAGAKHQCELCKKSYTRRVHLVAHKNSSHLGLRPFACATCEKAFTRKNDRNRHEKIHVRRN